MSHGEHKKAVDFIFKQVTANNYEIYDNYRILDLAVKMFIRLDTTNTYLKKFLDNLNKRFSHSEDDLGNDNLILLQRFYKWNNEKWVNKVKNKKIIVFNNSKF